jgi:pimeloyl-ACP methyl ester carboxylesterase
MDKIDDELVKDVLFGNMEDLGEIASLEAASDPFPLRMAKGIFSMMYSLVCYGLVFLVGTTTMVYFKQEGMLYHPAVPNEQYRYPENMPPGYRNPGEQGMEYEEVRIETKDKIKLQAWLVKANTNPKNCRTMIFFHENAGNIGTRIPNIEILIKRLNTNVLIVAYRGYSRSEGTPSEAGLALDADATLEYILNRDDIDKDRLYVFGRSLGGAVATQLAMKHSNQFKGMIVENTFTSIADMVDRIMPHVAPFKFLIQRIFYPTIDRINSVTCPILFIRGLKDEIVPCDQSIKLYETAKSAKFK